MPKPTVWEMESEVIGAEDLACPGSFVLALAILSGEWHFEQGVRPKVRLAIGCEKTQGCVQVHVALSLHVWSANEPGALFEGYAIRKACFMLWPFSLAETYFAGFLAAREALLLAYGQYALGRASDADVLRVLREGSPKWLFSQAAVVAGERRLYEAVPLLLSYLDSKDPDVLLKVIGALGRIGDPAALRPLGKVALSDLPQVPFVAVQAIADIGGREAERVLELIARQAKSEIVAKEAQEALENLRRAREEGENGR